MPFGRVVLVFVLLFFSLTSWLLRRRKVGLEGTAAFCSVPSAHRLRSAGSAVLLPGLGQCRVLQSFLPRAS